MHTSIHTQAFWSLRPILIILICLGAFQLCAQDAHTGGEHLFQPLIADYLGETAGSTSTIGFFYLDMDTNNDGVPDFAQVGDLDDLDGDGLVNRDDDDDDGDGILDVDDRQGYFQAAGPGAGKAPASMPAAAFRYGQVAAVSGMHENDYWQFVPNAIYESTGAEYQNQHGESFAEMFINPGAWLYVDENQDEIPDLLQLAAGDNRVPAYVLDQNFTTSHQGQTYPGLLGTWGDAQTGATLFHMTDDDFGAGSTSNYSDYTPYKVYNQLLYADSESNRDGNPDYLIYGTDDDQDPAIPVALRSTDPVGTPYWRYRVQHDRVSVERELVMFQTVYWSMDGSSVHTWYSKTQFNPDSAVGRAPNGAAASGDHFGLASPADLQGDEILDNWFPRFQSMIDHDRVANSAFGFGTDWLDIATAPTDGSSPLAHNPEHQEWVDQWENLTHSRQILAYLSVADMFARIPSDKQQLILDRYGVDVLSQEQNILVRANQGRQAHVVNLTFQNQTETLNLVGFEDLLGGGDRDHDDLLIALNRTLINENYLDIIDAPELETCASNGEFQLLGTISGNSQIAAITWSLNNGPQASISVSDDVLFALDVSIPLEERYLQTVVLRVWDVQGNVQVRHYEVRNTDFGIPLECDDMIVTVGPDEDGAEVVFETPTGLPAGAVFDWSIPSGSFFPLGETEVFLSVSDACGVTYECSFLVQVESAQGAGINGQTVNGDLIGYESIQDAIWAAEQDQLESVLIGEGVYDETIYVYGVHNLLIMAEGYVRLNGVAIMDSSNITLDGLDISSPNAWAAVQIGFGPDTANEEIFLVNCTVRDSLGVGVLIEDGNGFVALEGCTILDNGTVGVHTKGSADVLVAFSNITRNGQKGVDLSLDTFALLEFNSITDNTWFAIDREFDPGGGYPENVLLIQNIFAGNGGYVISGTHDQNLGNYHQMIDAADEQDGY